MVYASIILFFVYTFCLGFTLTSFVKNSGNFLERNLMRIGIGLAVLPFLGLVLNLVRIPIDWKLLLVLSLVYPAYYILKHRPKPNLNFKITKTDISILLMLVIFFANLYIYASGAFSYPYLEDDDSWSHALGIKYVAVEKKVFTDARIFHYIDPYPPAYDMLLGVLHQTNDSIYFTMKFFNALIIALSTIFFYFFVKEFTQNKNKALFGTFALMSIPAFMSHFIWALSLSVPLYFVCFYALERIKYDNKWWIVAGLSMVTTFTSSPTHSTYFGLFLVLYLVTKMILGRKILFYHSIAGLVGIALSFLFWWLPMIIKYGVKGTLQGIGFNFGLLREAGSAVAFMGTGDRIYSFSDFFIAQKLNMINNPIGIGVVLFTLVIISIILIYYFFFNLSTNLKAHSKIKFFISASIQSVSILLFSIGMILFIGSKNYNPTNPNDIVALANHMKTTLPYLFFSLLMLIGIALYLSKNIPEDKRWIVIALVWFLFAFYAVNASIYPYKLSAFRTWMLLAIPLCILASEAAFSVMSIAKQIFGNLGKFSVLLILLVGIYFTSTQQKIAINTSPGWPAGGFWTYVRDQSGNVYSPELEGYIWFKDNLPKNTKVFTFTNNAPVIGMDMYTCHWCKAVMDYQKRGFNETVKENYEWLKRNGYFYLVIDGQTAREFGENETQTKLQQLESSRLFNLKYQNKGIILLGI